MKLLPTFFTLLFCFCFVHTSGQDYFVSDSRTLALADASTAMSGYWSVFGNQAGLASVQKAVLAGTFQNKFLVRELSTATFTFVLPIQTSVIAVSFSQFGHIPFRRNKIGVAYAKSLAGHFRFGFQFNRYSIYLVENNSTETSYGLEIGSQYEFSEKFTIGAHIVNPYQTVIRLSSVTYRYPSLISLGTYFKVSQDFSWVTAINHDLEKHLTLKTGFEYNIRDRLFIRTGICGKPYQLSAGFGFKVSKTSFDFATSYNQYLGNSPSVSIQYQF